MVGHSGCIRYIYTLQIYNGIGLQNYNEIHRLYVANDHGKDSA